MQIQQLAVDALRPHPKNPRGGKGDVTELAESVRVHGFLSPLVVRDDGQGKYTILAGHRRHLAAKALKLAEVPCHVLEADAAKALEVLLVDNLHHEEVDPLKEAEAVEQLLKLGDWKVRDVADHLGKSPRWVAQRRELAKLSPAWRKRMGEEPWSTWPIRAWEALVQLVPETQDEVYTELGDHVDAGYAVECVERIVSERTHLIGKAPFDPLDGLLVKAAGPCSYCPKTSLSAPGLFDDGNPDDDIEKATCRDRVCWAEKCSASLRQRVEKAGQEQGRDDVVVVSSGHGQRADRPKGVRLLLSHQYEKAKETDKGALPAISIDGKGTKISWVKPSAYQRAVNRSKSHPGSSQKAVPPSPADLLAALEEQHIAAVESAVLDVFLEHAGKGSHPEPRRVLALVALVGLMPTGKPGHRIRVAHSIADGSKDLEAWCAAVWPAAVEAMTDALGWGDQDVKEAVLRVCGADMDELRKIAEARVPVSKQLALARKAAEQPPEEKPAKKRGAKKPVKKKAAKKAKVTAGA